MPTEPDIIGFASRWYPLAIETAQTMILPSGVSIRLIDAAIFLATKFEAFANRGEADLLGSHDLEDILNVVAGRLQLIDETKESAAAVRRYLAEQCVDLLAMKNFEYYLPGLIQDDDSSGTQSDLVLERLRAIVELGT